MTETAKKVSRQIWLPQSIVKAVKLQKASDNRPPRQQPTLHKAFVTMFEIGLDAYESGKIAWNVEPRDTSDSGYYVLCFDPDKYTRAEQIASVEGVTILDVIVSMIRFAADDFKFSKLN